MGTATAMQPYHYKSGDRPLEGYTIQRGVGRGAFGEVYYALSDSGREVALKSILGYEQIELRGVSQCMNLKSPHLVSIFDLRRNDEARNFVIMEYVAGPSLRELLDDSPSGLGAQKTAFFLREIGKGLTYLHDRGIVHRDLKPGNIFYEDGYVKIGDYGLSKAITPSQHSGQTITVGTVHYMAPEIGQGRYDRSIDIYAMGVLLYEMLTGHVPFFGASHGEILMKHLMETPDLSGIDEPFAGVIKKAMAKDPADRYQTVQEMVEAVFGAEHINQSVSVFRPDSLSMVAERTARKLTRTAEAGSSGNPPGSLRVDPPAGEAESDIWTQFGRKIERTVDRVGEARTRVQQSGVRLHEQWRGGHGREAAPPLAGPSAGEIDDPMTHRQRGMLVGVTAIVLAVAVDALSGRSPGSLFIVMAIWGGVSGLLLSRRYLFSNSRETGWARQIAYTGPAIVGLAVGSVFAAVVGEVLPLGQSRNVDFGGYLLTLGIASLFVRWDKCMVPHRRERVILGQVVWAGVAAYIVSLFIEDNQAMLYLGILAGVSLMVQLGSPWSPVIGRFSGDRTGRTRHRDGHGDAGIHAARPPLPGGHEHPAGHRAERRHAAERHGPKAYEAAADLPQAIHGMDRRASSLMPMWLKVLWGGVLFVTLALGAFFFVVMMISGFNGPVREEEAIAGLMGLLWAGVASAIAGRQIARTRLPGYWTALTRPLVSIFLLGLTAGVCALMATEPIGDEEGAILAICAIVSLGMVIVFRFINEKDPNAHRHPIQPAGPSDKLRTSALVLACIGFAGFGGLQRLYVGKVGTGILWLCTYGLAGIGQVFDLIMICTGEFTDKHGRKLVAWDSHELINLSAGRTDHPAGGAAPPAAWPAAKPFDPSPAVAAADEQETLVAAKPAVEHAAGPAETGSSIAMQGADSGSVALAPRRTNIPMTLLANFVLIPAVLVGVMVAFRLPSFARMGFFSQELANVLNDLFDGYSGWPALVTRIGTFVAPTLLAAAGLLFAIARTRAGVAHVSRAVLAIVGLGVAGKLARESLGRLDWVALYGSRHSLEQLELILDGLHRESIIAAMVTAAAAVVMLAWPERRSTVTKNLSGDEEGRK